MQSVKSKTMLFALSRSVCCQCVYAVLLYIVVFSMCILHYLSQGNDMASHLAGVRIFSLFFVSVQLESTTIRFGTYQLAFGGSPFKLVT